MSGWPNGQSHLTRGAWIETSPMKTARLKLASHLTRGAWIET
ncbi:hypothetical protein HMPREF1326_03065, partial [Akkermansia sp. KLE1605]